MIGRLERVTGYGLLLVGCVLALGPVVAIVALALGSPNNLSGTIQFSGGIHPGNLSTAWSQASFGSAMLNGSIITLLTVALSMVLSVPAGYALAAMRFAGRRLVTYGFMFGLLVPYESIVIPLYFDMRRFGLANSYVGIILALAGGSIAFGGFWMRASFLSVPLTLGEAARLDGASSFQAFVHIMIPAIRPAIMAMGVLLFMWNWNAFLLPLVLLSGSNVQTPTMALAFFQGTHTTDFTGLACAAIFVALPVVIVYLMLQKHFVRGILGAAVKG
jgi:raffinose/stachyose/melibiose transport system permease protein